jgi:hypothetical protein
MESSRALPEPPRPLESAPFSMERYDREIRALYRDMDGVAAITARKSLSEGELQVLQKFVAQANELLRYRESAEVPDSIVVPATVGDRELCVA